MAESEPFSSTIDPQGSGFFLLGLREPLSHKSKLVVALFLVTRQPYRPCMQLKIHQHGMAMTATELLCMMLTLLS